MSKIKQKTFRVIAKQEIIPEGKKTIPVSVVTRIVPEQELKDYPVRTRVIKPEKSMESVRVKICDLNEAPAEKWRLHQVRQYEKWENSEEGIHYSLGVMGDVTSEDEHNTFLIVKVLKRLPKKIREKVLNEVIFIHTTAAGTLSTWPAKAMTFIILNFRAIKTDKMKMRTIAHEIGHFISIPKNRLKPGPADRNEKMADDLSEKWGFGRAYKNYKDFKGVVSGPC